MGMSKPSTPKIPEAKPAARRPERIVDITPEEVELGSKTTQTGTVRRGGKRSLSRPTGGGSSSTKSSGLRV